MSCRRYYWLASGAILALTACNSDDHCSRRPWECPVTEVATGGASTAGTGGATGGASSDSGDTSCGVPASFKWSSSDALIGPDSNHISIKDPSIVYYGGLWHVFASTVDSGGNYSITYLNFNDWSQASSATQYPLSTLGSGYRAAPQAFYFRPQNKWYLVYDGGPSYSTTTDITTPSSWTSPKILASNGPSNWLDHWVICDSANCYLFFSADDGKFYRMQTSIGNFPGGWSSYVVVMQDSTTGNLFEASNVYKIKGTDKYMALIEAFNSESTGRRFFRSWTADSLDGAWTALADTYSNPFASAANVAFSVAAWTNDISHGEMIRDSYDETLTLDTCNLQYLYQGKDPSASGTYNLLPWKLGLLTRTN